MRRLTLGGGVGVVIVAVAGGIAVIVVAAAGGIAVVIVAAAGGIAVVVVAAAGFAVFEEGKGEEEGREPKFGFGF